MPLAIFGITSNILNLVATFAVLGLVAIWVALIVFTFNDARRRIADPFLVGCATAASLFPFIGTVVYTVLRPPEFLEDVKERETELDSSDTQLRHLRAAACGRCGFPVEHDFMRCPSCRTRLKQPCPTCDRPVGMEWKLCPYCETTLIAPKQRSSRSGSGSSKGRKKGVEKTRRSSRSPESGGSSRSATKSSSRSSAKSSSRSSRASSPEAQEATPSGSGQDRKGSTSRRSSRPTRRKVVVPDEEETGADSSQTPINGGTSTSGSSEASKPGDTSDNR